MWSAIGYVSSGITLVAFLGALALQAYRHSVDQKRELINTAPEDQRAALVSQALEIFRIDPAGLSPQQQFDLAVRLISERATRFNRMTSLVALLIVTGGVISCVAISRAVTVSAAESPSEKELPKAAQSQVEPKQARSQNDSPRNEPARHDPTNQNQATPTVAQIDAIERTLIGLINLESARVSFIQRLNSICNHGQVGGLSVKAKELLDKYRVLVASISAAYPPDFVIENFGTIRDLNVGLEARIETLDQIANSGPGGPNWSTAKWCKIADQFKEFQQRLKEFQRVFHNQLAKQAGNAAPKTTGP
jgi:hypothetical protein